MARTGRMTLGLWNTYDRLRFAEAHRRALARAAPVALAFDANLATFGFPFDRIRAGRRAGEAELGLTEDPDLATPERIAAWLATTTSIGDDGGAITALAAAGRFLAVAADRGLPPQFGTPVATTRRPDPARARRPEEVAAMLRAGESILLLFGLGPHGLPDEVRGRAGVHLDITDRGISLETATALGAVPALLSALSRSPDQRPGPGGPPAGRPAGTPGDSTAPPRHRRGPAPR